MTEMDVIEVIATDAAILLFSLAGLAATAVAILMDTRSQRSELARESVRVTADRSV